MKKEKENPNHHMGKETGYDLIDGAYHVAPLYQQQFRAISNEEAGIKQMLEIVVAHAGRDLTKLHEAREKVWKALADDVGLDMDLDWTYRDGVVKEKKHDKQADR